MIEALTTLIQALLKLPQVTLLQITLPRTRPQLRPGQVELLLLPAALPVRRQTQDCLSSQIKPNRSITLAWGLMAARIRFLTELRLLRQRKKWSKT
ncbi:hypothetical protein A3SK_0109785 [Pseudomonas amygdali pv. tabaci str. 6605]|nr:hypothetical protein A3SK_0109785 [Pseudomonas amygdali pv. tabaci str. 6605]